jgi:hypothetical protein
MPRVRRYPTLADRAAARPRRPLVSKQIGEGVVPAVVPPQDQQVREDAAYHLAGVCRDAADYRFLLKALDLAPPPRRRACP